jgi:hypothetical protein
LNESISHTKPAVRFDRHNRYIHNDLIDKTSLVETTSDVPTSVANNVREKILTRMNPGGNGANADVLPSTPRTHLALKRLGILQEVFYPYRTVIIYPGAFAKATS